jgi:hypothetical protein
VGPEPSLRLSPGLLDTARDRGGGVLFALHEFESMVPVVRCWSLVIFPRAAPVPVVSGLQDISTPAIVPNEPRLSRSRSGLSGALCRPRPVQGRQ